MYNKNIIFSVSILFSFILISCKTGKATKENKNYIQEIKNFQSKLNKEFEDSKTSPLDSLDRIHFKKLDFFPIDKKYRILADFKKNPRPVPFKYPTNTNRTPIYIKYGDVFFEIDGKKRHLEIYQNQENLKDSIYKKYLFLPFADETNGYETYGGGRYLDILIPKDSPKIVIDFNKAYNPYCAYSHRWSCPLVPPANHLPVEIRAGVKKFNHLKKEK